MGKIMITANKKLKNAPGIRSKGFTLIELLIVIAVIGILAAALLAAIDPIDKVKQGRDTKVVNDVRSIYDGANRVYTNYGEWPDGATGDAMIADIVDKGELKNDPVNPSPSARVWFRRRASPSARHIHGGRCRCRFSDRAPPARPIEA